MSRATVSYVLNDTPNKSISDATRRLVLSTADRLGHVPHAPARALRSGKSDIVVALVPGFTLGAVTDTILEQLDRALTKKQMALLVHRHAGDERPLARLLSLVLPSVVVSLGGMSSPDKNSLSNSTVKLLDLRSIVSHHTIGRMQVEYLQSIGHTRLGYAFPADPALIPIATERLAGVRDEARAHGLPEPLVIDMGFDIGDAERAIARWRKEGITAVCAHNDALAAVIVSTLDTNGMDERDLAVIGVDNSQVSEHRLTTISIEVDELSRRVSEAVLCLVDDRVVPEPGPEPLFRLVRRTSA
ncbi:LacI family DNA-binding transcriptional regulator [Microbacterium ulmi]|uniref:LacI family DNA-binding transcriptional regulator n=1 Tax=Microbacterium ulmi TaxID=179095 RepID=A0A7Y2M1E1_9MICO|nr:DNA-binding LacI/PurR family transcriptional regulator [Microbacterium ulmi]NNH04014.1 LacI family DNA-binding transcriptional regulator [Microbacterium ulmi]